MKKTMFFSLFGLFFLVGCGNKSEFSSLSSIPEPVINTAISFESLFVPETGLFSQKIIITNATGLDYNHLYEENISYVSGYVYTYTYEDLGIKITTPPNMEPYFSQRTDGLIFKRHGNIIYRSGATDQGAEYIQMFTKNPSVPLETIIEQQHLGTGCMVYKRFQNSDPMNDNRFKEKRFGVDIQNLFDITGPDGSLGSDIECHPDKEFPNIFGPIFFVQSKYHQDRYYKISLSDGCAPGPCSIFEKIEFF